MKREEFCIAQSIIAAVKSISSMYESSGSEQEIHLGDSRHNITECVKKATSEWQRENAVELLSSLVVPNKEICVTPESEPVPGTLDD